MTGAMVLGDVGTIRLTPRMSVERAIGPSPQPVKRNGVANAREAMPDAILWDASPLPRDGLQKWL